VIFLLDTMRLKEDFFWRLSNSDTDPQPIHLHADTSEDFAQHLLAEEKRRKRDGTWEWVKIRKRNDWLDCFDPETDLLTYNGWKSVKDVNEKDSIATINLNSDQIEYQNPVRLVRRYHAGQMVRIKGMRIDILITPNHRMVVAKNRYKTKNSKSVLLRVDNEFKLAQDLSIFDSLKLTAKWEGLNYEHVIIPASYKDEWSNRGDMQCIFRTKYGNWRVYIQRRNGNIDKTFKSLKIAKKFRDDVRGEPQRLIEPERIIDPLDWAAFLGWYISEGWKMRADNQTKGSKLSRRIGISQNEGTDKWNQIAELLSRLPWNWRYAGNSFLLTSKQLYDFLTDIDLGHNCYDKKVPQWIKDACPDIIKAFLATAIDGDGWIQHNFRTYSTVSPQLADDIQELFIKIGNASNIKIRPPVPIKLRGEISYNTVQQYHITECKTKRASLRDYKNNSLIHEENYEGMVYCVTVPNGTLICRRNGKSFIAGNCSIYAHACADPQWHGGVRVLKEPPKHPGSPGDRPVKSKPQKEESAWLPTPKNWI